MNDTNSQDTRSKVSSILRSVLTQLMDAEFLAPEPAVITLNNVTVSLSTGEIIAPRFTDDRTYVQAAIGIVDDIGTHPVVHRKLGVLLTGHYNPNVTVGNMLHQGHVALRVIENNLGPAPTPELSFETVCDYLRRLKDPGDIEKMFQALDEAKNHPDWTIHRLQELHADGLDDTVKAVIATMEAGARLDLIADVGNRGFHDRYLVAQVVVLDRS